MPSSCKASKGVRISHSIFSEESSVLQSIKASRNLASNLLSAWYHLGWHLQKLVKVTLKGAFVPAPCKAIKKMLNSKQSAKVALEGAQFPGPLHSCQERDEYGTKESLIASLLHTQHINIMNTQQPNRTPNMHGNDHDWRENWLEHEKASRRQQLQWYFVSDRIMS